MKYLKLLVKVIFAAAFIFGGVMHFVNTSFYLPMMPSYLPYHIELVYISGVVETLLGVLLLVPKYSRYAAFGIVLLLFAIFPANLNMYLNPTKFPDVTETALLIRLPIQLLLIIWAYVYTKKATKTKKKTI